MNLLISFRCKDPIYLGNLSVVFFDPSGSRIKTLNDGVIKDNRIVFSLPESSEISKMDVKTVESDGTDQIIIVESSVHESDAQWHVIKEFEIYLSPDIIGLDLTPVHTASSALDLQSAFDELVSAREQEKNHIADIKLKAKLGRSLPLVDVLSLFLSNSIESQKGITIVQGGGGYLELRNSGLTDTESLKVLAICHAKVDSERYESEMALQAINDDPMLLTKFAQHLAQHSPTLKLPPLGEYLIAIRSDPSVYSEARVWVSEGMK